MKAWYFSTADKKLRYEDGREIAIGVTHTVEGKIARCQNGLHGSKRLIDALKWAPGDVVWRVELSGDIDDDGNKIVARSRTYLAGGIDIGDVLRKFARMCALDVIDKWDAPEIVIRYLKSGDESIRSDAYHAAYYAAYYAASSDASYAASYAAYYAAYYAAPSVAYYAASSAAYHAASSTASSAASYAASSAASYAAYYAASSDASYAARKKQNRRLTAMVSRAIKENA